MNNGAGQQRTVGVRVEQGANFRVRGVVGKLTGEAGLARLVPDPQVPGCPGHFKESWAVFYRKK